MTTTHRLAALLAAAFLLGMLADRIVFAASRPAPVIPAAALGQPGPDRARTEAPRELGVPPAQASSAPPSPSPTVAASPRSKALTGATSVSGIATWYATGPGGGHAAAGPGLRAFLGPHWRGQVVTVCRGTTCLETVVDDWCLCSRGDRIIDLADEDFARLAPLSRGVLQVVVHG